MSYHKSQELNEIFSALAQAQGEIKVAIKDSANPFFKSKYANLQSVVESARPSLAKYGLSVTQFVDQDDTGHECLCTMLCHKSGQWILSRMRINPVKPDPQSLGSCITYLRRYMFASIVGVYDGFEDDDGNDASTESPVINISVPAPVQNTNREVQQSLDNSDLVSEKQVKFISFQVGQNRELLKDVLQKYGIQNIQSMKKSDAQHALAYIESQKSR
jgi:hypothetical protein